MATAAFSPLPVVSSFTTTGRVTSNTGFSFAPNPKVIGRRSGTNMRIRMQEFKDEVTTSKEEEDKQKQKQKDDGVVVKAETEIEPVEEELTETQKLLKKVKEAGTAGVVSYALWELAFWAISVPVCVFAYYELFGHFPDFTDKEDLSKLGGEAFAFVNFARFAVPLRIGLALSTTGWIQENVVDKFMKKKDD